MVLVLSAFITIAAYAGTSVLFGAFLAGTFLTYLPSKHPDGPFVVMSREEGEREADKSPTFVHTFERYLLDVQKYLMEPLFFASVGFAIPFLKLWTGKRIWRGIVYSLLMAFAKVKPTPFGGMHEIKTYISCSLLLVYGFLFGKLCTPSPRRRDR
jgi:Kef-type K+ transport system membrane component KefB